MYPDRAATVEEPSPEVVAKELYTDRASSATQLADDSTELVNPFVTQGSATSAKATEAAPGQGHHGHAVRSMTQRVLDTIKWTLVIGVALTSLFIPAIRDPALNASRSFICASPLRPSFAFCRGPQDVVVMHDFAALAQVHSMTLATLYDTAVGVWMLSDELAHQGRSAKQLAYYAEDSTLPVRDTLSRDLHLLHENTGTAANSLNKLGATTVGTVMRCVPDCSCQRKPC